MQTIMRGNIRFGNLQLAKIEYIVVLLKNSNIGLFPYNNGPKFFKKSIV